MIKVDSVSKNYGPIVAVDGISFEVNQGEIVGFVGPNGAGKSTTLKMLATYIFPTQGTIEIHGQDVTKNPLEVRRQIGYLSGDTPLYQNMRVDQFIAFVGKVRGLSGTVLKKQFDWVIEKLELKEVLLKRVNQCSTGFRQRIGLSIALIHDPDIIILDEPTHGFDPLQVLAFRNLLKELVPGRAILFSSHIISEVEAISNRIVLINQGRFLGVGTVKELAGQIGKSSATLEEIFIKLVHRSEEGSNV